MQALRLRLPTLSVRVRAAPRFGREHGVVCAGARQSFRRSRGLVVRCRTGTAILKKDDEAAPALDGGKPVSTGFTVVMKFDGSALASADKMREVADLIGSSPDETPVVVLSAMGKTTNNLLLAGEKAVSCGARKVCEIPELSVVKKLHLRTMDELGLDRTVVSGLLDELEQHLKGIAMIKELSPRSRDYLVSFGECMSTRIFAAYMNKLGKKARQYDAFDIGFITTDDFTNARILNVTYRTVAKRLLGDWKDDPAIPIVTGSLGKGRKSGAVTTIGRRGSDLTATTIGKGLGLREIQIWKDIDGVLTCDPNFCAQINYEDLTILRELGSGAFGTVYLAELRGTGYVAVKFLNKNCYAGGSPSHEEREELLREARVLSKLRHPNVLEFLGVVEDGPDGTLAIVTEFLVDGSLWNVFQCKDKYLLDDHKKLKIAMDVAFAMEYMHSKGLVHFDLKAINLLMNLNGENGPICKVGDFGLSKIKKNALTTGGMRGTLRWMAPEVLDGYIKVSEKVDVYSYAIVLWEILTGEVPYGKMPNGVIKLGVKENNLRPSVPAHCCPEWEKLMKSCWAHDPAQRPTFTEILVQLKAMSAMPKYAKAAGN